MNVTNYRTDANNVVNFVNFNQDCTSLAVGTKTGYKLFSLNSVDTLEQIYENDTGDTCIIERLFSSSLVALVSLSAPRKLRVCHFKKGTEICYYSYSNTILAIKLNRARLVVCLEESLYIHNIRDMKVLHTIRDTPPNPTGLCTLSINSDNCYLAYPGSNTIGEVQIFDAFNLHAKTMIPAHDSPLAALSFNPSGTRIATASEKGTVIRVFSIVDSVKLYEFRRGVKRCVSISSLGFSTDSSFLCCSSNTETVHVFRLDEPKESMMHAPIDDNQSWMGYISKAVSLSATYLPTQVTDVFNQGRAFASVHLPFQGKKNVCAVTKIQGALRLLVASSDGYLYVYNLDTGESGDCTLVKQHRGHTKFQQSTCSLATVVHAVLTILLDGYLEHVDSPISVNKDSKKPASPKSINNDQKSKGTTGISSYAGIVKGNSPGIMSESEKFQEIVAAVETPPKDGFKLDDDKEFPPVFS